MHPQKHRLEQVSLITATWQCCFYIRHLGMLVLLTSHTCRTSEVIPWILQILQSQYSEILLSQNIGLCIFNQTRGFSKEVYPPRVCLKGCQAGEMKSSEYLHIWNQWSKGEEAIRETAKVPDSQAQCKLEPSWQWYSGDHTLAEDGWSTACFNHMSDILPPFQGSLA